MKPLLLLSLLLNAVLLLVAARHGKHQPTAAISRVSPAEAAPNPQRMAALRRVAARTAAWAALESRDPAQFISNLRSCGCPEQTIRQLMTLQICRKHRQQLLALRQEQSRAWDFTRNRSQSDWQQLSKATGESRTATENELERLLGVPVNQLRADLLGWAWHSPSMDFLSLEKQAQLRVVNQRYQELTDEAKQGLLPWESEPAIQARVQELERQKWDELALLLTPEESAAYRLRQSPAALYALRHLPEAKSEDEFRRMVGAVEKVGIAEPRMDPAFARHVPRDPNLEAEERTYVEKQAELEALLKQTLGEDRVAQQQRDEDARQAEENEGQRQAAEQQERARVLTQAADVGISAEDATRFMDRLKELEPTMNKKFEELEKSLENSPAKSQAIEAAIQAEMEKVAVETIGEKGRALVQKIVVKDGSTAIHWR